MIKSAPRRDKKFMASAIGRRKSREDGSVKKKSGGWYEAAREGILKTDPCNHQSLHILSDMLTGYRLQARQGQDCWLPPPNFRMSNRKDQENVAKLEAMTCLIYLLSLQDLNQIVEGPFFWCQETMDTKKPPAWHHWTRWLGDCWKDGKMTA